MEKEAAGFLKNAGDSYNQYQTLAVPIPEYSPVQGDSSRTFIGRLVREILFVTDVSEIKIRVNRGFDFCLLTHVFGW